ncbi:MAG TPA: DJ-1/PfpI family protein [Chloroflexaceae bacterium]|mgnify:CR=1 FL=1|nr:DJ-1/PfpI family protein [Chloroflexaceae bacterium]
MTPTTAPPVSRRLRARVGRGLAYALAAVLLPLVVGAAGAGAHFAGFRLGDPTPPPYAGPLPEPPAHDPARRTAVIVAANSGTEGTDFLAPYEVLATSGAFNLYAVAPERRLTHLFPGAQSQRGVDFVPHYSFAEYDRAFGAAPDLIVVPYMPFDQAPEYQVILDWIRANAGPDTTLLTICGGLLNLADTGLLDGRTATTHHNVFAPMRERHPEVRLVEGVRYVEDGKLISSAGITAGVDATLHTLGRMLGPAAAASVAGRLGYPYAHFLADPTYALPVPRGPGVLLNAYRVGKTALGVALYPGIGEIELGSVIDTYPRSITAVNHTVAPERTAIVSRNGLALVPRWSFADAPGLDRLLIPGLAVEEATRQSFARWSAGRGGPAAELIHAAGGYPYDRTLADMAAREGANVVEHAAYILEYPTGGATLDAPAYPAGMVARPVLLALLGLGLAYALDRRGLARRAARLRGAGAGAA